MKKYFAIAAFAFAALVSCQKEIAKEEVIPAPIPDNYIGYTLTASLGEQTKSTLDGKKVVWAVGDKVAVFADGAGNALEFEVKEASESGVMFSGNAPAEASSFVAVYPFDSALGIADGVVKVNIPAEQVIPEGGDIDPKAMPSAAVFETVSSKPTFYNLMSLVKFNVGENEYVDEVRIGTDGEICLAGEIDAKVYAAAEPDVFNNCDENIVIKSEVPLLPNKDYYAVVAPAEGVTGFNAGGVSGSRQTLRSAAEAVTFKRNGGLNLGDITKDASWLYRYISNADDLKGFLASARDCPEGWLVEVLEDIQMLGDEIPEIEVGEEEPGLTAAAPFYKGDFDGCGYTINGWKSEGVAMFGEMYGTIKNLTIASSCMFSKPKPGFFGFVVRDLYGKMENCVNKANLECDLTGEKHVIGMLAGHLAGAEACVVDCVNDGIIEASFVVDNETRMGTQYIGGVLGVIGVPCENTRIANCVNNGPIHVVGDNGGVIGSSMLSNIYIGGIASGTGVHSGDENNQTGYTSNYGLITDCLNTADMSAEYNGGTGGYFRVGGIIGYGECAIANCTNEGKISYQNSLENLNAGPALGGIAAVVAGTAPVSASNCVNKGEVSLSGIFGNAGGKYYSGCAGVHATSVGGCFGVVGDNTKLIEYCDNYGPVGANALMPVGNKSVQAYGGIAGYSYAAVNNCSNYGTLNTYSEVYTKHVGGIVGYCYSDIVDCTNEGEIIEENDATKLTNTNGATNIAGIVGYPATGSQYVKGCVNKADVTVTGASIALRLGGVIAIGYQDIIDCSNFGTVSGTNKEGTKMKFDTYGGGIVGFMNLADAKMTGCENNGKISMNTNLNEGNTYVGGLVGRLAQNPMYVDNSTNNADVYVTCSHATGTPINLAGAVGRVETNATLTNVVNNGNVLQETPVGTRIAGICGYINTVNQVTFKDCVNNGDVVFKDTGAWASGYSYVGGIAGYFGKPKANAVMTYDGCINNGNVFCDLTDLKWCVRLGGIACIAGGENNHDDKFFNCENHGDVICPGTTAGKVICGGIIGYSEKQSKITCDGCLNEGKMEVGGAGYAGAIQGAAAGNTASVFTNFTVKGSTVVKCGEGGGAALVVASAQKYTTPMTGTVAGKVIIGETEVTVDAENYQNYLFFKGNDGTTDVTGVTFAE